MFALVCTSKNDAVISRHRTMNAAAKANAKLQREVKNESSLAYVPTGLRRLDGERLEMLRGEQSNKWETIKKESMQ